MLLLVAMLAASPAHGWGGGETASVPGARPTPIGPVAAAPSPNGAQLKVFIADMMGWGEVANLTLMPGQEVGVVLLLVDQQGVPIPDQVLEIQSTSGNRVDNPKPVTGDDGRAQVTITARKLGTDVIRVATARAVTTVTLIVQETVDGQGHSFKVEPKNIPPLVLEGAVPWATFAKVEVSEGEDGLEIPKFSPEVKRLDGQKVKLQGFMVPLENQERQKHFVLSANPPTCFFCLPGGPESLVEIECTKGLVFTFEPIALSGTLDVMEDNDLGLFYRLRDAVPEAPR
jgi:hypothetical protein